MVFRLLFVLGLFLSFGVSAQSIRDGITFYTWNDHIQGKISACPLISGTNPIAYKIYNHNNPGPALSDSEYRALAGDSEFFALTDGQKLYSRKERRIVDLLTAYMAIQGYDLNDLDDPRRSIPIDN